MSIKHTFKWIILSVIVIIIGLSIGAISYIYTKVSEFDKVFAEGVLVNETNIGGLTRDEAVKKVQDDLAQQVKDKHLVVYKDDISYQIALEELGSEYNIGEILDEAYKVGHQGNIFEKYHYMKSTPENTIPFELKYIYDKEKFHAFLEAYTSKFHIEPIDANIIRENKKFIITPEIKGQKLDLAATVEKAFNALDDNPLQSIEIEAVTHVIPAKHTAESFKDIQNVVASFTTSYNNADANRNANLVVAANKINTKLMPGEIFSLAKQLEPINFNEGYRSSKVIVNGQLENGIGGGVCQIASTLYNTILLTDINITMRQNHSLAVAYVPLGRDATYATNAIDFKFENNTAYPMFIESYCENNKVYVNIFAHASIKSEYDIKFDSVTTEVISPPGPKYVDDPELLVGKQVEVIKPLSGKKVKLYKLYYKAGALIKKELVNNSYYRPRGATIKVGTKVDDAPVFNPEVPSEPEIIWPPSETELFMPDIPIFDEPILDEPILDEPILDEPILDESISEDSILFE